MPLSQELARHAKGSELHLDPEILEVVRNLTVALENPAAPAAGTSYTQHGGTQVGVGAMGENKGVVNIRN